MARKVKKQLRLNDDHCLLWIKDPSVSPFENDNSFKYRNILSRKNILSDADIKNPKSFLNEVKRRCFFKSALRQKIIEQINKYKKEGTLRLYTFNDTFSFPNEYINPPFNLEECRKWVINHLVNPRTNNAISEDSNIYIELLYTAIQYDELLIPEGINADTLNIVKNIKYRLEFMKQNDEAFLKHDVASFDKRLKVALPDPIRIKKINTFGVPSSSSSIKPLNNLERIELRDMVLEKKEKKRLVAEYQYKKGQHSKKDKTEDKTIFADFRDFLTDLEDEVLNGNRLIDEILKDTSLKDRSDITTAVVNYFKKKGYDDDKISNILRQNDLSTIDGIVKNFINNIYAQLLDPSFTLPPEKAIGCLTYINIRDYFKNCQIIEQIIIELYDFITPYSFAKYFPKYFLSIVDDIIPRDFVAKRTIDLRVIIPIPRTAASTSNYQNYYYKLLYNPIAKTHNELRLPEGMGVLIGKQLTNAINDLEDPNFNNYSEDRVITDDNPLNGFTYDECKDWVMVPIINPRTFKRILIDSPIYNRLLCISYQYDTKLIPRIITSRGYEILQGLSEIIENILKEEDKLPQSRDQLEKFIVDKEAQYEKSKGKGKMLISDIIGLKWKDVGLRKPTKGIDITADNEALANAITAKVHQARRAPRSSLDPLAFYAIFTKDEWETLNIANLQRNSFIKIKRHYYIPVIVKSYTDINKKSNSSTTRTANTKDIKANYIVGRYYTIIECLRWARNPNRDPKNPDILIITDSAEYNTIFEQALLYDYNIEPINITPRGIKYMNKILKKRSEFIHTSEFPKCSSRREKSIKSINSAACNAIKNIYDGDEYGGIYKKLKEKMINICEKYNQDPFMSMDGLKYSIGMEFDVIPDIYYSQKYNLNYYQDSALASIIIYYNDLKGQIYNKEYRDIFVNDFNKFYVHIYEIGDKLKITKKNAIDAGGVKREFITNLYKELFCDEENPKRPFMLPTDNKLNKYYINPNFEPDENFKKVIAAYKKKEAKRMKKNPNFIENFDTESDYVYIYFIIGKLLCIAVVNEEIGIPNELSTYILAGFINQPKNLNDDDILYFYTREFHNAQYYVNMISNYNIKTLDSDSVLLSFNDTYIISKGGDIKITTANFVAFILQQSKHVITKNFLIDGEVNAAKNMKKMYISLFAGFSNQIRKFLYKKRVTTEQLSLLITNEQLNKVLLQELASKIKIEIEVRYTTDVGTYRGTRMTDNEKRERVDELKGYISNIITKKRASETDKEHYNFIRKLLQFWSGYNYYNKKKDYIISYKYGVGTNVNRLPEAHTCTYTIDIFGCPSILQTPEEREKYIYDKLNFPANLETPEEKERFMYDKFKWAVEAQEMELHGGSS